MKSYFQLQYRRLNRHLADWGVSPVWGYPLVVASFYLISDYLFQKTGLAGYLLVLAGLSLQFQLSHTQRSEFLTVLFGSRRTAVIRLVENLLVAFPFLAFLAYKLNRPEYLLLLLGSISLALFLVAYVLTGMAISVNNFNLGIFSFLLPFLTAANFYVKPEPEYYVWVYADGPSGFLRQKVRSAFLNITLLTLPILVALLAYDPSQLGWSLFFYLSGFLFLAAIILAKYAAYPSAMGLPEGIVIALCLYFPPILLLVIPYFFKKAVARLKPILHDTSY